MALQKTITSSIGVISNYHNIYSLGKTDNEFRVLVRSYADVQYRNKEKEFESLSRNINDYINQHALLMGLSNVEGEMTDEQKQQKIQLEEDISEYNLLSQTSIWWVSQQEFLLPWNGSDEFSFETVYNLLKQTDTFQGATDC